MDTAPASSPSPAAPAAGEAPVAQKTPANLPSHNDPRRTNTGDPPATSQPSDPDHDINTYHRSSDGPDEDQYNYTCSDEKYLETSSICSWEEEDDGNWERDPEDEYTMGGSRRPHGQRRRTQTDLTGVFSVEEKNEVIKLVSDILDSMKDQISNIFHSPPITPASTENPQHSWLSLSLLKGKSNKPATPQPQGNNPTSPSSADQQNASKTYAKAHGIVEKEEKEAMTPQLQELKKECLVVFNKWQGNVLLRVKDISVKDPDAPEPPATRGGRGGRGSRGARGDRGAPQGGRGTRRGRGRGGQLSVKTGGAFVPLGMVDAYRAPCCFY